VLDKFSHSNPKSGRSATGMMWSTCTAGLARQVSHIGLAHNLLSLSFFHCRVLLTMVAVGDRLLWQPHRFPAGTVRLHLAHTRGGRLGIVVHCF
jgi:hypothetical protein